VEWLNTVSGYWHPITVHVTLFGADAAAADARTRDYQTRVRAFRAVDG